MRDAGRRQAVHLWAFGTAGRIPERETPMQRQYLVQGRLAHWGIAPHTFQELLAQRSSSEASLSRPSLSLVLSNMRLVRSDAEW
jgi:hypothetical protein